ncbi:hypothetical protein Plhal304r1_c009g0034741 [Plasmopara halstedii]
MTRSVEETYIEHCIQHIKLVDKYDQPQLRDSANFYQVIESSRRCTQMVIPSTTSILMMSHLTFGNDG